MIRGLMNNDKQTRAERLRDLLEEKKRKIRDQILRDASDKLGRDYTVDFKRGMDEADLATIQNLQSLGLRLVDIRQNELLQLSQAISKLDEGTYGICEDCGEEISEPRLAAMVHATHCLRCAAQTEKLNRTQ
jgi:DnaK suppressor protein